MAIKEAGEPLLRAIKADLDEARRMAAAGKRRGLGSVTIADMVGLLASCNARVGAMQGEAARRQVAMTAEDWELVERTKETAELQCMVLMEHHEEAGLFNESRISMAEVLFKKDAEGWTEKGARHVALFHPGCCHTCGSCMGVNGVQGHDSSLGDKYEGRTLEQCYRLKEIELAGPCTVSVHQPVAVCGGKGHRGGGPAHRLEAEQVREVPTADEAPGGGLPTEQGG